MNVKVKQQFLAILVTLGVIGTAGAQSYSARYLDLKGTRLNEPAVWNVGSDSVYEIFTTDFSGNVVCYRADTLDVVWTKKLGNDSLTAPVVGDFLQMGAPVLAFGSALGTVYFVWPGSGEVISSIKTDLSYVLPPAVAARASGDEVVFADDKGFVAGFKVDPATGGAVESFRVENTAGDNTAFSVIGQMSGAPSCADLDGDGGPEVILASETGFLQVLSLSADGSGEPRRFHTRLTQNTRVTTLAGVGDFSGQGAAMFGFGVGTTLQFFNWTPSAEARNAISPALQAPGYGNTHGHLLAGEINQDTVVDLVSSADSTVAARYFGQDMTGAKALFDIAPQHLTTQESPFSAPLPVTLKSGEKAVLAVDKSGTAFLWQPTSPDNSSSRIGGLPVPTGFTPGGDFTGRGKLSLVVYNEDSSRLSVVTLDEVALSSQAAPSLTSGINFSRTGQWGAGWLDEYQSRRAKAAQALQTARAMSGEDKDDPALTVDKISIIAGLDPADPASKKLAVRGDSKVGIGFGMIGLLALLVIAGAGGILLFGKGRRR